MNGAFTPLPKQILTQKVMNPGKDSIELTPDQVVNYRGQVDSKSASKVLKDLIEKRKKTKKTIYLFINSPGGSIIDGIYFIEAAKKIENVKTVVIFAASMAHAIVQNLPGERLIMPSGVAMAHRAAGRFEGQFETGEVESQIKLWKAIVTDLEIKNSKRIGISLEEYKEKVKDEWWSYGVQAVTEHVVDRMQEFTCSNELIDAKVSETSEGFFGTSETEYSECPLLVFPL